MASAVGDEGAGFRAFRRRPMIRCRAAGSRSAVIPLLAARCRRCPGRARIRGRVQPRDDPRRHRHLAGGAPTPRPRDQRASASAPPGIGRPSPRCRPESGPVGSLVAAPRTFRHGSPTPRSRRGRRPRVREAYEAGRRPCPPSWRRLPPRMASCRPRPRSTSCPRAAAGGDPPSSGGGSPAGDLASRHPGDVGTSRTRRPSWRALGGEPDALARRWTDVRNESAFLLA
jgi:hypothetical protein